MYYLVVWSLVYSPLRCRRTLFWTQPVEVALGHEDLSSSPWSFDCQILVQNLRLMTERYLLFFYCKIIVC